MNRRVVTDDYRGPDRRAHEDNSFVGVLKQAYDLGAIIRGLFQASAILIAVAWAWNTLENTAGQNRDRIIALEATTRSHAQQLVEVPLLRQSMVTMQDAVGTVSKGLAESLKQDALMRETNATLIERMEGLRVQIQRLEATLRGHPR